MPSMTTVKCAECNSEFEARTADVNRGWGKFCSKSCKAKTQTRKTKINGPDYRAEGRTVKQMAKGKYAKSKFKKGVAPWTAQGVTKAEFIEAQEEYGGFPIFDKWGNVDSIIPDPFDNSQDCQNSD